MFLDCAGSEANDFRNLLRAPKALLTGMMSQFLCCRC